MATEVFPSTIPWSWVVENLARAQEVDVAVLRDLMKEGPQLSNSLGKEVTEMIALRCMECLFDPVTGFKDDPLSSHRRKDEFDSQKCESLLRSILQENSVVDFMKGGSDHMARNAHYFVENKKATLPRTSLEQLKDTILKASHPLVASLYKASGLVVHNQDKAETVGASKTESELMVDGIGTDDQAIAAEENNNSLNSLQRICLDGTHISSKKLSSDGLNAENHDKVSVGIDIDRHDLLARDCKQNANSGAQCVEKHSVAHCITEDASERNLPRVNVKFCELKDEDAPKCMKTNDTIHGTSSEQLLGDEVELDGMEDHNKPEVSSDSDGYCDEENALAARKRQFLSSQCSISQDSPDSLTEQNQCIKCKTGGELLVCWVTGCRLSFHESCLGTSASFDHRGAFYCPFCAYSCAISDYNRAKEKASLARRQLSLFIGGSISGQSRYRSKKLTRKDREQPGHSGNIRKRCRPNHINNMATPIKNPRSGNSKDRQEHLELEEASALGAGDKMHCRVKNSDALNIQLHKTSKERGRRKKVVRGEANEQQSGNQLEHSCDSSKSSHGEKTTVLVNVAHDEAGNEVKVSQPEAMKQSNIAVSILIGESDGCAEIEKGSVSTSKYALRCRKQTNCYTFSPLPMPQLRRKKVVWTVEEVTALKEGVKKFAGDDVDNKAIPWTAILEYGSSVFQKGRTPVDLKDKWRNITTRGSPNAKSVHLST